MEMRRIPGTELEVSRLCIGTMTFGESLDQAQVNDAVAIARDRGVNFIDTADIYPVRKNGVSEEMVGRAVKNCRDDFVIATKLGGRMGPGPDDQGLGAKHMVSAVEGSLKRLDIDRIDVLYMHFPDKTTSAESIVVTANELIKQGKIRSYGISNFAAWEACEMVLTAKRLGLEPPVVSEDVYNLVTRGVEDELLPFMARYPMGLTVYNPLSGGLLSGKYTSMTPPVGSRFETNPGYRARYFLPENVDAAGKLQKIASENGMSLLELSFRWLLAQEPVTSIILGFSSTEQLEANIDAAEKKWEAELPTEEINKVWQELTGRRYSYHK